MEEFICSILNRMFLHCTLPSSGYLRSYLEELTSFVFSVGVSEEDSRWVYTCAENGGDAEVVICVEVKNGNVQHIACSGTAAGQVKKTKKA